MLGLAPAHPDVEDRAQDALVAFLASGLPRFDASRGTHEALLGVIARNLALTDLRSRSRRLRLAARLSAETPRSGTEAEHRRVEAIRDLGRILGALPATHADALLRIDLHGERIATVARQLGKSYAAVNARVGHARANARRVARELAAA